MAITKRAVPKAEKTAEVESAAKESVKEPGMASAATENKNSAPKKEAVAAASEDSKASDKKEASKKPVVKMEVSGDGKKAGDKPSEKKSSSRKAAMTESLVIQFRGREVSRAKIEERFKDVWTKDFGRKMNDIKDVTYYIKPEDSAVYFVVNGEDQGSFAI